ncbi:MAG: CpaF family protein, partial [Anaerolineales bacterium]|nr:CpaF family protein [Anaerolineales bacterium]
PRDTLARVETMALMAGMDLPIRAIREQIASAIDLIIHQSRMQDIFRFEQTAIEDGKVLGELVPTGLRPRYMDKIEGAGIHLPPSIFSIKRG